MKSEKRITLALDASAHRKLKILAAYGDKTQSEVISNLIDTRFQDLGLKLPDHRPPIIKAIDEAKKKGIS